MKDSELSQEKKRLREQFPNADQYKLNALDGLLEQAAYEKLYLKKLNKQAMVTGLIKVHPDNPGLQQVLPISNEITKHSATLTNIMNQLMKHLSIESDEWEDGLDDYE